MWAVDSKWDQKEVSFLFVCADGTLHSWWVFLKPAGHTEGLGVGRKTVSQDWRLGGGWQRQDKQLHRFRDAS